MKRLKYILIFSGSIFLSCTDSGGTFNSSACPTTSACGCSGHNKAECGNDICCKWTVGKGCGCR